MDKKERVREQTRQRVRKHRLVKTKLKTLNNEFSSSDESGSEQMEVEVLSNISAVMDQDNERFQRCDDGNFSSAENSSPDLLRNEGEDFSSQGTADRDSSDYNGFSDSSEDSNAGDPNYDYGIEKEILQIKEWAIESKICQTHLDNLLAILRERLLPTLPKSSKTFLGTSAASYNLEDMEDGVGGIGKFVYFGITNGLRACINKELHRNKLILLQLHVDGMSLTKSGNEQFWATLGKVHLDSDLYKPFEIAIFQGKSKPKSPEIYLHKLVDELNELHANGIEISGTQFEVRLKCVIADTPARAFIKNTLGHCGLVACERCTVVGVKEDHTTVFPSTDAEKRTDASFRSYQQPEHHHGPSPFLRVMPFMNMIAFFVLDFMHLCCQGIMKKLIEYWMSSDFNFKLSNRSKTEISSRLVYMRSQIPCEFQRKTSSLKSIAKWKATQFRFFLLYCGPIVLKGILREELYNHFLILHVACRILCSKFLCLKYAKQGKQYLTSFFIAMKDYYGDKSQILNAHHLIHLADDVEFMKCSLSIITAFPFENLLGKIRNYLRTPHRPLAQLCRRLFEKSQLRKEKAKVPSLVEIIKCSSRKVVKEIMYHEFIITTKSPNNVIILVDDTIIEVHKFIGQSENPELLRIEGVVWEKKKPIFNYPCDSSKLQMWELKSKPSKIKITRPVSSTKNKLVKMSFMKENGTERFFVVGMLH